MATYEEIQKDVKDHHHRTMKTCWIAHVKELNGLPVRNAWNRESNNRTYPCPSQERDWIEESMRRFGMLPTRTRR
jgi:hypothetical protein